MKPEPAKPSGAPLYESDYYAWAIEQAEALSHGDLERLDLANLAEEVADLGKSERNAVLSHATTVIEHLQKLEYSPDPQPRRGWVVTIRVQRDHLERKITPTLRAILDRELHRCYRNARDLVLLKQDDIDDHAVPAACPYTLDQILDRDWLPANRHGLELPARAGAHH